MSFTWVVCRKSYPDPKQATRLQDALRYCLATETNGGQPLSVELGYVRLPTDAVTRARKAISEIRTE